MVKVVEGVHERAALGEGASGAGGLGGPGAQVDAQGGCRCGGSGGGALGRAGVLQCAESRVPFLHRGEACEAPDRSHEIG